MKYGIGWKGSEKMSRREWVGEVIAGLSLVAVLVGLYILLLMAGSM